MEHSNKPIILFDGICNYCNSIINFIIRQDKQKKFVFTTLQSSAARQLLEQYQLPTSDFDSFVLVDQGRAYLRSSAALMVLNKLPWYWKWIQIFWIVPRFLRDAVYNTVARNRYKWFGRKETCMIPTPDLKARFLS